MTLFKLIYPSPIGDLSLVADEVGLVGIWFVGQAYFERGLSGQPKVGLSCSAVGASLSSNSEE